MPTTQPSSSTSSSQRIEEIKKYVRNYLLYGDSDSLGSLYKNLHGSSSERGGSGKISSSQAKRILELFTDLKESLKNTSDENEKIRIFNEKIIKILIFLQYQRKRQILPPRSEFLISLEDISKEILDFLKKQNIKNLGKYLEEIADRYYFLAEMFVIANYKYKK